MNEHPKASALPLDITQLQNLEQLRDDEFWDYARALAHQIPAAVQSEDYLECALGTGTCLIPLTMLNEVVLPPHRLTLLPATPEWMPGIVAWRGEAIAVIDLTLYLSGHPVDLSNAILLIVNHANIPIGLLVPSIGQTTSIQQGPQDTLSTDDIEGPTDPTAPADFSALAALEALAAPKAPAPTPHMPSRTAGVKGMQQGAFVLDVPILLADVVQRIETAAANE
jgi:chemotaxis signal transduction protein